MLLDETGLSGWAWGESIPRSRVVGCTPWWHEIIALLEVVRHSLDADGAQVNRTLPCDMETPPLAHGKRRAAALNGFVSTDEAFRLAVVAGALSLARLDARTLHGLFNRVALDQVALVDARVAGKVLWDRSAR